MSAISGRTLHSTNKYQYFDPYSWIPPMVSLANPERGWVGPLCLAVYNEVEFVLVSLITVLAAEANRSRLSIRVGGLIKRQRDGETKLHYQLTFPSFRSVQGF
jgi:hypothetical protein